MTVTRPVSVRPTVSVYTSSIIQQCYYMFQIIFLLGLVTAAMADTRPLYTPGSSEVRIVLNLLAPGARRYDP